MRKALGHPGCGCWGRQTLALETFTSIGHAGVNGILELKPFKESSLSATHHSRSGIDNISAIANNDGLKSDDSWIRAYQTRSCSATPGPARPDAGW